MKGMLSKAFVLTLVLSGVVSASMPATPSFWERVKAVATGAKNYVADSRVADYASSFAGRVNNVVVAPYNAAADLVAQSGLTNYVSNIGFVKNDKFYNATVGNAVSKVAPYAVAVAIAYAAYRGYRYFRPASEEVVYGPLTKAETEALVAKKAQVKRTAKTEKEALFDALDALARKAGANQGTLSDSIEFNSLRNFEFLENASENKGKFVSMADCLSNKDIKSFFAQLSSAVADVDNAVSGKRIAAVSGLNELVTAIKTYYNSKPEVQHSRLNSKQEAADKASNAGYAQRAYNALVNRYTIGALTAAGLGYAGYKYYTK